MTDETILARNIVLVDEDGNPSVMLTGEKSEAGPGLLIHTPEGGEVLVSISVSEGKPYLILGKRGEGRQISLGFTDEDRAYILLKDEDGTARVISPTGP